MPTFANLQDQWRTWRLHQIGRRSRSNLTAVNAPAPSLRHTVVDGSITSAAALDRERLARRFLVTARCRDDASSGTGKVGGVAAAAGGNIAAAAMAGAIGFRLSISANFVISDAPGSTYQD